MLWHIFFSKVETVQKYHVPTCWAETEVDHCWLMSWSDNEDSTSVKMQPILEFKGQAFQYVLSTPGAQLQKIRNIWWASQILSLTAHSVKLHETVIEKMRKH